MDLLSLTSPVLLTHINDKTIGGELVLVMHCVQMPSEVYSKQVEKFFEKIMVSRNVSA